MSWLDGTADTMQMNMGKLGEAVRDTEAWRAAVRAVTESDMTGQLNNSSQFEQVRALKTQ